MSDPKNLSGFDQLLRGTTSALNEAAFGIPKGVTGFFNPEAKEAWENWESEAPEAKSIGGGIGAIGSAFIPVAGIAGKGLQAAKVLGEGSKIGRGIVKAGEGLEALSKTVPGVRGNLGNMMKLGATEGLLGQGIRDVAQGQGFDPGSLATATTFGAGGGALAHGIGSLLRGFKGIENAGNNAYLSSAGITPQMAMQYAARDVGGGPMNMAANQGLKDSIQELAEKGRELFGGKLPTPENLGEMAGQLQSKFKSLDQAVQTANGGALKPEFKTVFDANATNAFAPLGAKWEGTDLGFKTVWEKGQPLNVYNQLETLSKAEKDPIQWARNVLGSGVAESEESAIIASQILKNQTAIKEGLPLTEIADDVRSAMGAIWKSQKIPYTPDSIYKNVRDKIKNASGLFEARKMADELEKSGREMGSAFGKVQQEAADILGRELDNSIGDYTAGMNVPDIRQLGQQWKTMLPFAKGNVRQVLGDVAPAQMGSPTAFNQAAASMMGAGAAGGNPIGILTGLFGNPIAKGIKDATTRGLADLGPIAGKAADSPLLQKIVETAQGTGGLGGRGAALLANQEPQKISPQMAPGLIATEHVKALKGDPTAQNNFMNHVESGIKMHWLQATRGLPLFGPADESNPRFVAFRRGMMNYMGGDPSQGGQIDPVRAGKVIFINDNDAKRFSETAQGLRTLQQSMPGITTGPLGSIQRFFDPQQQVRLDALKEGFNRLAPSGASRAETDKVFDTALASPFTGGNRMDMLRNYLNLANPQNMKLINEVM